MSKTSRKLDKKIKTMVGMYVQETDPEKAKELMKQIRSIADDQKTLNAIEEAYKKSPGKKDKIKDFLKKKREKDKIEKELLENVLKEKLKNEQTEVAAEPKETAEETEES